MKEQTLVNWEEESLRLLQELVAANSSNPPGNEESAAQVVIDFCHRYDLDYTVQYVQEQRPNVLVSVKGRKPGKKLVLCSHLDVVPANQAEGWETNPFEPIIKGYRLFGRGACDAKVMVATMLIALAKLASEADFCGELVFAGVMGEEAGGFGAKALQANGFKADAVVIGEPTNFNICLGHKGRVQFQLDILGRSAHASAPSAGVNAAYQSWPIIKAIEEYSTDIAMLKDLHLESEASIALTQLFTVGNNVATIPDQVSCILDRRTLPSEIVDEVIQHFVHYIEQKAEQHSLHVKTSYKKGASACLTDKNHPLVRITETTLHHVGISPKKTGFPACCDLYIFHENDIPGIILGPGDLVENRAHGANEFIQLEQVFTAVRIYHLLAKNYLKSL